MQNELETLAKILKRCEPSKFTKQALAMLAVGEMPDAELLKRCGIRDNGVTL